MSKKYVYLFSEGDSSMKNLLGGKGVNLCEMTKIGVPVPQGFIVSTEACNQYYEDGKVFIPNKELMDKYNELLLTNDSLGYIYNLARESEKMLAATLVGDTETMAEILKFAHDTEAPIFSYSNEAELSAVVNLVYLAARDKYRIEREDKAGKGYADFIFYPNNRAADCIILELKVDSTPK